MESLESKGYVEPLKEYIKSGKPYLGVCLGLQTLFEASEESPGIKGLGIIPETITRFTVGPDLAVPHMGWNGVNVRKANPFVDAGTSERFYFVHSFLALPRQQGTMPSWALCTTNYGCEFVSAVRHGNVLATQFHPEKSGAAGLKLLERFFLHASGSGVNLMGGTDGTALPASNPTTLAKRVIACLDVRANDDGDIVVTKGDQYDVREKDDDRSVRNLGKPVKVAQGYYNQGADEITFLNITSWRNSPLRDAPMLEVLKQTSKNVFVPLTIGGGIRAYTDPDGTAFTAVDVAGIYFRSGADKVSIGTDAVHAALAYYKSGGKKTGSSCVEQISRVYGNQAVVISVDPHRVYVDTPDGTKHHTFKTAHPGPNGEVFCWYQCTIKGGRENADLGAYELARACEQLGAGEILLNCIDKDGTNSGYDLELVRDIKQGVSIPVIASSGAGCPEHFSVSGFFTFYF